MSIYVLGMMPLVILILGIVVSLIVMGGIADADQQAKRLESDSPDQNGTGDHDLKSGKGRILRFDKNQRAS